ATTPTSPCYALRIRQNGEVLVACTTKIHRFDSSGNLISSLIPTCNGACNLFALNLDPDGTTVWSGDDVTGIIYHVDIATGNTIKQFASNPYVGLYGLAVYGEQTAAAKSIHLTPQYANLTVGISATICAQLSNYPDLFNVSVTFNLFGVN